MKVGSQNGSPLSLFTRGCCGWRRCGGILGHDGLPLVEFVAGAYFLGHGDGEVLALDGLFHRLEIHAYFLDGQRDGSRRGADDPGLVAHEQFAGLHEELGNTELALISDTLGDVFLDACGAGAVFGRPLTQALPHVVTVPKTAVKDLGQALVPLVDALLGVGAVADGP